MSRVQGVGKTETSATTTLTVGAGDGLSATTGGNTIIVAVAARNLSSGGLASLVVTDNTANVYTQDAVNTTVKQGYGLYRCSSALSATSITATANSSSTIAMFVWEWSGLNSSPVDQTNTITAFASASPSSTSITTGTANDVIFAFVAWGGSQTDSGPHTGGFTAETLQSSIVSLNDSQLLPAYRIVASTGTYSFGTTLSGSVQSGGSIAAYKATASTHPSSLQVGWDLPNATSSQTYGGTLGTSEQWAAGILSYLPASSSAPDTPTGVVATPGNANCIVTIGSLPATHGSPIASYTVKVYNGVTLEQTITGLSTVDPVNSGWQITGTGVVNGTPVQFTVAAVDAASQSSADSSKSAAVTPTTGSAPGTPTIVLAASDGQITVTATPSGGGAPTGYYFRIYLQGNLVAIQPQVSATYTFTGLADFIPYGVTAQAINLYGQSLECTASYATPLAMPFSVSAAPAAGPPTITVVIGFQARANLGPYFVLDDPIRGALDNTSYVLAPPLAGIDVSSWLCGQITVTRGRSREIDAFTTGELSFTLRNEDRRFDPTNTASPYYPGIQPRTPVQAYLNGIQIFGGYVDDYDVDYEMPNICTVTVTCHDSFVLLSTATLLAYSAAQELSGSRVSDVLARPEVNFAGASQLDTGTLLMQASTQDQVVALDHLQTVALSEGGALYVDRTGTLQFDDQNTIASNIVNYGNGQMTFTDTGLTYRGQLVAYTQVSLQSAVLLLFNQIIGARTGGTAQIADDTASQALYLLRSYSLSSLENVSDDDVLTICQTMLSRYSTPEVRFDTVTAELTSQSLANQNALADLDLTNVIVTERTPPGGGLAITQLSIVEQMAWSFNVSTPAYTLSISVGNASTGGF